jgi:hypothetical protein
MFGWVLSELGLCGIIGIIGRYEFVWRGIEFDFE